jgi:hypothetical protein
MRPGARRLALLVARPSTVGHAHLEPSVLRRVVRCIRSGIDRSCAIPVPAQESLKPIPAVSTTQPPFADPGIVHVRLRQGSGPLMAPPPLPAAIDRTRPAFSAAVPGDESGSSARHPPAWGSPEAEAALAQWLVEFALGSDDEAKLLEGFAEQLDQSCVPVFRVSTGAEALHPTFDARGVRWRRGLGIEREEILHDRQDVDDEEWLKSPFRELADSNAEIMRRLDLGLDPGPVDLVSDRSTRRLLGCRHQLAAPHDGPVRARV